MTFASTYLPGGETRLVPTAFFPASTDEGWTLHPEWLDEEGRLLASIGGFLIESGERKILLDTGFGPRHVEFPGFGPFDGGRLLESLRQAVLEPDQIDTVVYTHLHLDHVNASVRKDDDAWRLAFPNARFLIRSSEWSHWAGKNDPAGLYRRRKRPSPTASTSTTPTRKSRRASASCRRRVTRRATTRW